MYLQQFLLLGRTTTPGKILKTKAGKDFGVFDLSVKEYKPDDEVTQYFKINVFDTKQLEALEKINKGDLVMVDGKVKLNQWQDRNGKTQAEIQVIGFKFKVIK